MIKKYVSLILAIGVAVFLYPIQAMSRTGKSLTASSDSRPKVAFFIGEDMKICKDGRIWGQNNKEAGEHLGVSKRIYKPKPYIKKGYNINSAYPKGHKINCGENNRNYKGGITPLRKKIRDLPEYLQWRDDIYARDNYTCQKCGLHSGNGKAVYLEAHHSDKSFSELFTEFLREYNQFSPYKDKDTLVRLAMNWQPFWEAEGETYCNDCHKLTKQGRRK